MQSPGQGSFKSSTCHPRQSLAYAAFVCSPSSLLFQVPPPPLFAAFPETPANCERPHQLPGILDSLRALQMSSNSFFISFLKSSDSSLSHSLDTKHQACFIHYLFSSRRQTPATHFRVGSHLWSFTLPGLGFSIFLWMGDPSLDTGHCSSSVAHLRSRLSCSWRCSCCWHLRPRWN